MLMRRVRRTLVGAFALGLVALAIWFWQAASSPLTVAPEPSCPSSWCMSAQRTM